MIKTAFNIKEGSDFNIKDLDQGVQKILTLVGRTIN